MDRSTPRGTSWRVYLRVSPHGGTAGVFAGVEQPRPACILHKPKRPVRWSTADVCSRGHAQEDPGGCSPDKVC